VGHSRGARRYAGGSSNVRLNNSYVRFNTALGAGVPNCMLLCALPAPGTHAVLRRDSREV
jgi:hypothetical protein